MPEVEEVILGSTASLYQGCIDYEDIGHVPSPDTVFGSRDIPVRHMQTLGCHVCITLYDAWTLNSAFGLDFPWVPIAPIDSYPLARANKERYRNAFRVIAMSEWGKGILEDGGVTEVTYIPHMVDTSNYRPLPEAEKSKLKKKLGFPEDCFLVGMVARTTKTNPVNRKGFGEGFQALAPLMQQHKDIYLYIHAPVYMGEDSADLPGLADIFGVPWDRCKGLDVYAEMMGIPDPAMNEIYNAFDVYLAPSAGEGFNVPLIESQAAGVPIVANDATAQSENVKAGWLVKPKASIVNPLNTQWDVADALGSDVKCENCGHINHKTGLLDALTEAYEMLKDKAARKKLSKEARQYANKFDVQTVAAMHWRPWVRQLAVELGLS